MLIGTNYKVCLWVCRADWVSIILLFQVAWRALRWRRFQSAPGLCWRWGSRSGPSTRRWDTASSSTPAGTLLREDHSPRRSIVCFPVYVLLRPLLFFHSINNIYPLQASWIGSLHCCCYYYHVSPCLLGRHGTAELYTHASICSVYETNEWSATIHTTSQILKFTFQKKASIMFSSCCRSMLALREFLKHVAYKTQGWTEYNLVFKSQRNPYLRIDLLYINISHKCLFFWNTILDTGWWHTFFFLFSFTESCCRGNVRTSLQRDCRKHGWLFEATPHKVWLLMLKVHFIRFPMLSTTQGMCSALKGKYAC